MTKAVYIDKYYGPRLRTTVNQPDGATGTSNSQVIAHKYMFMSKPQSVKGTFVPGTKFRYPNGWSMSWAGGDLNLFGVIRYRHGGNTTVTISGSLPVNGFVGQPTTPASLVARAELDALLKVKDQKVNVGVSLGERKEVAQMMVSNFTKVAKAYKSFKRGDFRNAGRALGLGWKDMPNRWLEYQYGWKPLLGDIHTACSEINRNDYEDPTRTWIFARGYAKDTERVRRESATSFNGVTVHHLDELHHEAKVRFDFKPNPALGLDRTLAQWGISDPLAIAWELIPFSFVVDWAVPIGDYLTAMGAGKPYIFITGSQTRFSRATRVSWLSKSHKDILTASGSAGSERKVMYRYRYYSFPSPDARALLANRNPESRTIATRVANALSILSGMFR